MKQKETKTAPQRKFEENTILVVKVEKIMSEKEERD